MGAEINLAGLLTVTGEDGGRWHLESAQAQVAFARLVLERDRGTTRDQLADVVWPDQLPRTWASALRSVVSRVRGFVLAALPSIDQPLVAQGGRYLLRLPEDVVVDVEAAERAVIAAQDALVAGDFEAARRLSCEGADRLRAPFLPDHDGTWVSSWRDHLAELLVTSLETASHAAAALGDCTRALVLADEATTRAPLRESAHRCRMAAHAAAGNRGEALRAYQRLRRLLADELGVDPAPDTEAAYLELLGSTPMPMRPMRVGGARPDGVVPFVGREAEMAAVNEAWTETLVGRRQLLYVTGEAGGGKTRLAKEAGARIAAGGGLVLFGRCDRESLIPYQPFVEAFDGYVAATPLEELFALTRASRSELAAVFPSVYPPRRFERPADRTKLFDAIAELTVDTTRERPMLLLFDNLQWADQDTLWLLRHLLRQPNQARLLVIALARDDVTAPSPAPEVLHGLERDGLVTRLPLSGFDRGTVEALAEQLLPADLDHAALAEQVMADTAGNPFMVVELLRQRDTAEAWTEGRPLPVPRSVRDAVAAKLNAVQNADVERLLLAAAVAGPIFDIDVAARAAGLDFSAALDALDLALSSGLLAEARPGRGFAEYRFRHELARRALTSQLSGARHHHLKARVVQAK